MSRKRDLLLSLLSEQPSSGYQVVVDASAINENLNIYDGQDNTGTLLGSIPAGGTETFNVSSGYIYVDSVNYGFVATFGDNAVNPYPVSSNGQLLIIPLGGNN